MNKEARLFTVALSNEEANNLDPNEKSLVKESLENFSVGFHFTENKKSKGNFRNSRNKLCETSDHTPKPLYARKMAINPLVSEEIRLILAIDLKSSEIASSVNWTAPKALKISENDNTLNNGMRSGFL
jgi:hypothetical protein